MFNFSTPIPLSQAAKDDILAREGFEPEPVAPIHIASHKHVVVVEAAKALAKGKASARIFVDGSGRLVRLRSVEGAALSLAPLTEAEAANAIYSSTSVLHGTDFKCKADDFGGVCDCAPAALSSPLVRQAMASATEIARPLRRISRWPTFSQDGHAVTKRGYDPVSQIFLATHDQFDIPENPTCEDAAAAVEYLRGALHAGFPWADEQIDTANALGFSLSHVVKPMVGTTPLTVISGNGKNTGKTTLSELTFLALAGERPQSNAGFTLVAEEQRKFFDSLINLHAPLVLLDNIRAGSELRGDALAVSLSQPRWSGRTLGRNDSHFETTIDHLLAATGNNIRAGEDVRRRSYSIQLEFRGNAALRQFERSIYADVLNDRKRIVESLLTIVLAWQAAGEPAPTSRPMNGFERWHAVVGGALEFAGVEGFLGRMDEEMTATDVESDMWQEHLEWLYEVFGEEKFSVKEAYDALSEDEMSEDEQPLPPGFSTNAGNKKQKLGLAYGRVAGTFFDSGFCLTKAGKTHGNVRAYRLDLLDETRERLAADAATASNVSQLHAA